MRNPRRLAQVQGLPFLKGYVGPYWKDGTVLYAPRSHQIVTAAAQLWRLEYLLPPAADNSVSQGYVREGAREETINHKRGRLT